MKTIVLSLFFFLLATTNIAAQTKQQDSIAVLIFDKMSAIIGDLESCSFRLSTATDLPDTTFGLVKGLTDHTVYMSGPNKMLVNTHGQKGHHQLMYNGHQLAYFSFDENNYGILSAPETSIQLIDTMHVKYGIEFPAADFFYPAFTDDLIADSDVVKYLGMVKIDNKEYFHIIASGKEKKMEFWINNDAYNLPAKFVITYLTEKGNPQYQATFSDWQINPALPAAMFDFLPPAGAAQVRIMSKN